MFFFPSTYAYMTLQLIMHLCVMSSCSTVFLLLTSLRVPIANLTTLEPANETTQTPEENDFLSDYNDNYYVPFSIYVFHVINFLGLLWFNWFILGLGRMVLTATFATWYHMEDKSKISKIILLKSFLTMIW